MRFSNHITIKDDNELTRGSFLHDGVVQVTSLGMMVNFLDTTEITKSDIVTLGFTLFTDFID